MSQNDYIITFDENGTPYIEHGVMDAVKSAVQGVGRGIRQNHKYILKLVEDGKARYFYTQEEVKAYYDEKKKQAAGAVDQAKDAVKGAAGRAKDAASTAASAVKSAAGNAVTNGRSNYERMKGEFRDRSQQMTESVKGAAGRAKDAATTAAKSASTSAQEMIDNARTAAKGAASKATSAAKGAAASAQEMIDKARTATKDASDAAQDKIDRARSAVQSRVNDTASKTAYSEWSENDSDFDEKNYSDKNHVEDTDFYIFKRPDGQWVVLEEDMKWVLPKGVTGNDSGIKSALQKVADRASSAEAIDNDNDNYTARQWADAVTEAIEDAAKKKK